MIEDAIKERIANAAWNIKLFQGVECDPSYNYLVGMATADLNVAADLIKELQDHVPQNLLHL